MSRDFNETVVAIGSSLRGAMTSMDRSAQGVVFILADDGALRGLLTDGDVRRALLAGGTLESPVTEYMNQNFIAGSIANSEEANLALINARVRCLPILDENGRLVDVLFWADFYRLPIMEPVLQGREMEYVTDCLTTNWISSQGQYVERFQESFQSYHLLNHALCVSSGTAALHLAMVALGVGPGDEVLIPDLTFVSPASMTLLCGATPVFVDVDRVTWTMDPLDIQKRITKKTRAIVPVHLYGHPCDMDQIMAIAKKHNLFVIEDCAEALGAEYKGRKVGTIGDVGTFSFFANKVITTGEGGMVITNNPDLHRKMQILRDHGMTPEKRYWHNVAGFNYRLTNIQAAIGLAQMERVDKFQIYRAQVVERYNEQLGRMPGVLIPPCADWAKNIYWLYSVIIDESAAGIDRDGMMARLATYGIDTRPFFYPLHQQPPFKSEMGKSFPVADCLSARGLSLPTSNNIELSDVDRVCSAIKSILF